MRRRTALICFCLVGLLILACCQGDRRVSLRYKFTPGLILHYIQKANVSEQVIEDGVITTHTRYKYDLDVEVECLSFVDDTTMKVAERASTDTRTNISDDSTWVDSVDYRAERVGLALANGKVLQIDLDPNVPPERTEYLRSYHQQGNPIFPVGEKPVGYSWTQTTMVVLPDETLEASTTYEIKSLVREAGYNCAIIGYDGQLLLPLGVRPDDPEQRSGVDRIHASGLLYFAYEEGFVVKQVEHWVVNGDRHRIVEGDTIVYRVERDYNSTFQLLREETGS